MQDSPMRRGESLENFWKQDLWILSAIFIRIRRISIPGGLIGLKPEKKMQGGELIISVFQSV